MTVEKLDWNGQLYDLREAMHSAGPGRLVEIQGGRRSGVAAFTELMRARLDEWGHWKIQLNPVDPRTNAVPAAILRMEEKLNLKPTATRGSAPKLTVEAGSRICAEGDVNLGDITIYAPRGGYDDQVLQPLRLRRIEKALAEKLKKHPACLILYAAQAFPESLAKWIWMEWWADGLQTLVQAGLRVVTVIDPYEEGTSSIRRAAPDTVIRLGDLYQGPDFESALKDLTGLILERVPGHTADTAEAQALALLESWENCPATVHSAVGATLRKLARHA